MTQKTNKPICVVLGGSFNPPTKAHRILMETAMKYLQADMGLYVPSSDFYVSRKVSRQTYANALPERTRLSLLNAMCSKADRTSVDTCEYGDTSKGRTLQTLEEIQAKYPNHAIWFIIGSDKLDVFHRWGTGKTILRKFNLLWVGRDNLSAEAEIGKSPLLSQFKDHQKVMSEPTESSGISSSAFWEKASTGHPDEAWDLLDDRVTQILRKHLTTRA